MKETSNIRRTLALNVKFYRYALKYTQEQLAEKCDLSPRYVSDIENANGNIPIDTLEIIAHTLEIEPYLLIKEEKHPPIPKRVNMK